MRIKEITQPQEEIVTLDEAKEHLNVCIEEDNALIQGLITASRQFCEDATNLKLAERNFEIYLDNFCDEIEIKLSPLNSISEITYIDPDGVEQTLNSSVYELDNCGMVSYLRLAYDQSWPSARRQKNSIKIIVSAGYQEAPESIKIAAKIVVGDFYENRELQDFQSFSTNETVKSLLRMARLPC